MGGVQPGQQQKQHGAAGGAFVFCLTRTAEGIGSSFRGEQRSCADCDLCSSRLRARGGWVIRLFGGDDVKAAMWEGSSRVVRLKEDAVSCR